MSLAATSTVVNIDPSFPKGCPTGFTVQHTGISSYDPLGYYVCQNASGKTPFTATSCGIMGMTYENAALLAGSAAALIFMKGGARWLVGLGGLAAAFVMGIGTHPQNELQPDGTVKCVSAGTSW